MGKNYQPQLVKAGFLNHQQYYYLKQQQPIPGSKRLKTYSKPNSIPKLGVGFKHVLSSPLFGEISDFDWYFSHGLKLTPTSRNWGIRWTHFLTRVLFGFSTTGSLAVLLDVSCLFCLGQDETTWLIQEKFSMETMGYPCIDCVISHVWVFLMYVTCVFTVQFIYWNVHVITLNYTVIYSHTWSPQHTFVLLFGLEKTPF